MSVIKQIYNIAFTEKIETLLPEHYSLNTYYKSKDNDYQYIMRNSQGYFHIMEITKIQHGFTFNHYKINKNEMIEDLGGHYKHYKTLEEITSSIEQEGA